MNAEFINILSLLLYFFAGTASIALLLNWALKRFGSPGQPSSKPAPASKDKDSLKGGSASIPRSDYKTPRQQKI